MSNANDHMDNIRENTNQILDQSASLRNPSPHFARLGREIGKEVYMLYGQKEDDTLDTQAQEAYSKIVAIACVSFFMGNGMLILLTGFSALSQQIIPGLFMPFFTYGAHGSLLVLAGTGLTLIKWIIPKKHQDSISEPEYTAIVHIGLFVLAVGSLLLMFSSLPTSPLYGVIPLTILFGGLWLSAEAWLIGVFDEEVDLKERILQPIKHRTTAKNATKNLLSRELIIICLGIGVVGTVTGAFLDALIYKIGGATRLPDEHLNAAFPLIDHIFGLPLFIQVSSIAIGAIGCLYLYGAAVIWMSREESLRETLYQMSSIVTVVGALIICYILGSITTGILLVSIPLMMSSEFAWSFIIAPVLMIGGLYVYIPIFLYPYFVARQPRLLAGFKAAWNTSKKNRITGFILIYNSIIGFLITAVVFLVIFLIVFEIIAYLAPSQWNLQWIEIFMIVVSILFAQMFQVAMSTDGVRQLCREENMRT